MNISNTRYLYCVKKYSLDKNLMQKDLLKQDCCLICLANFDPKIKIPMVICLQQHLCCKPCLLLYEQKKIIFKCPLCGKPDIPIKEMRKFRYYFYFKDQINQIKAYCWSKLQTEAQQLSILKSKQLQSNIHLLTSGTPKQIRIIVQNLVEQAKSLFKINKFKVAIYIFQDIIEKNLIQDKGQFIGLGGYEESIGYYENNAYRWFERTYKNRRISVNDLLALCYLSQPNFEHQKEWFEQMLEKDPNNMRLTYGLAITFHNASKLDQAQKLYKKITQMNPSFARAWEMLGFIEMKRKNSQLLLTYMNECLSHDPSNIYAKFASSLYTNGNYSQVMYKIHNQDINYVRPLFHLGKYEYNNKPSNSLSYWNTCIEINPNYLDPFVLKAKFLINKSRRPRQGLQILHSVYKKQITNQQRVSCNCYFGAAYYFLRDGPKAIYYFKLAFSDQNYEKDVGGFTMLIRSYISNNQEQKGEELCKLAINKYPNNTKFKQMLLQCQTELKKRCQSELKRKQQLERIKNGSCIIF